MMEKNLEVIAKDLPEALSLYKEVPKLINTVATSVQSMLHRVKNKEFPTAKGISFLEVKYHLLLSYLINLMYVIMRKTSGTKIEGDLAINRLVEIRTVLEKMRPIDQKLKYQIDKLIKTVATGNVNPDDPLRFKANPNNLMSKFSDEGDDSGSDEEKNKETKPKIYIPPKLSAVHYEGGETAHDRRQKQLEQARKRALSSSIIQELKQQYDEGPEEIRETDFRKLKKNKEARARTEYEEEYMMRFSLTKKQKHEAQLSTKTNLLDLTKFEDISALDADVESMPLKKKKKNYNKKNYKKNNKKNRKR